MNLFSCMLLSVGVVMKGYLYCTNVSSSRRNVSYWSLLDLFCAPLANSFFIHGSSGMSFMVANFLAEQARANHRSSSSSSNNNNGRVPEITQQPANSIATPNTNSSSSSSSPRRSSASATRPTSMSPVRRTGDISSSRGTGASVAASLDGPSLVLSCIRRAEALLPSAGTLATPVGGGGKGERRLFRGPFFFVFRTYFASRYEDIGVRVFGSSRS